MKKENKTERVRVWVTPSQKRKLLEKANKANMNLSDYMLWCVSNQPAVPTFSWESDDLASIRDALILTTKNIERLTAGIMMIGSASIKDIEKIERQQRELNQHYDRLLQQYDAQRKSTTKIARRLVREWKKSERNIS